MASRVTATLFVVAVVEHAGKFLAIRERKHGQKWYLPAGGVEPGETVAAALVRETREEAAILVEPEGLTGVEENWYPSEGGPIAWYRFVARCRLVGDPTPKQKPDEHSLEARWVSEDEAATLEWRGREVLALVRAARGPLIPMPTP